MPWRRTFINRQARRPATLAIALASIVLPLAIAGLEVSAVSGTNQPAEGADARNPAGPIVVLGASYAQGWELKSIAGHEVVNRGVTGQQSFEFLERFERDVVGSRPRAVIIWGFINDIFRAPADVEPSLERIRDSYIRMIAAAREQGILPILATEVPMGPMGSWSETVMSWVGWAMGKESYQQRINRHVLSTNRALIEIGKTERLLVLDFHAIVSDPDGMRRRPFTQADGSHLTPAGYAALTAYATPLLEKHVAR